ncbi:MAG: hypothetical protein V4584_08045 [Verrucomicrobiota bacterium]
MNKKTLILGSGLVLAAGLFLPSGLKEVPPAGSSNSRTLSTKMDHPAAGRSGSSRQAPAASEDARPGLLEKLEAVAKSGGPFDREGFASLLARLVEIDPATAADFATALPAGPVREEALRRVSQAWASEDPAEAENWAAELPDESERQSALTDVCMRIARSDAAQALGIAENHGIGAAPGSVTENLVQQWAVQDFPAAAAWIKARPAGEKREQMVMRLALVQSATRPGEAARLVVEEIPEGAVQTEAVITVIYQWASRDMAGAREWVNLFPESPLRDRAESELTNMAAYQSPEQPQLQKQTN